MKVIQRLWFHVRRIVEKVSWKWQKLVHPIEAEKKLEELETAANIMPDSQIKEIEEAIEPSVESLPELIPEKTMAFHSWRDNGSCNFATASSYRKKIRDEVQWGRKNGIEVFLVDYTTPFGLLSLETLLEERKQYGDFRVYVYQSRYFSKRRTYRLVKETPLEMLFMSAEADYHYGCLPELIFIHVLPHIAIHYSETGRMVIESKLPAARTGKFLL